MTPPLSSDLVPIEDADPAADHIVHLVGARSDQVIDHLRGVTVAHAERGVAQTVVLVEPRPRPSLSTRFDPSIEVVQTPAVGGVLARWHQALDAVIGVVAQRPAASVHLHGVMPGVMGVYAARFRGLRARLYVSRPGSHLLAPVDGVGELLVSLMNPGWCAAPAAAGAGAASAMRMNHRALGVALPTRDPVARTRGKPRDRGESPVGVEVDAAFSSLVRREADRPVLLAGGRAPHAEAVALYAQLAVLLSEEALDIGFEWIGATDAEASAQLAAANVAVHAADDVAARASRLAAAWVYVSFESDRRLSADLAEALAAGLPCVVWDPSHQHDIVSHDHNGLVCTTREQLLACVAELIDNGETRQRLGAAARALAGAAFRRDASAARTVS